MHDIDHQKLGPIRYAVQKGAITTLAGSEKILSLSFVSCQKGSRKIAIELTNAPGSDPAGGLQPAGMPRLVCSSPGPAINSLVKTDLAARWEVGSLGDTLARGLSPTELRRCVSIDVVQSVVPPPGSPQKSQRIEMEITPYARALDSVFTSCGEKSAFAPGEQAPVAAAQAAPVARPGPSPAGAPAAVPWKPARTTAKGRTNVRASAGLDSPIVAKLGPGTRILVQQTPTAWWKVVPRGGTGFRGYIREDRLVFE